MARGMTEQEVADKLKVSVNTIKYHKQKIYKRLDASCFSEALIKAIKTNILNPDEL
jgi:DNA-binding NarL/FixJ family response regulator